MATTRRARGSRSRAVFAAGLLAAMAIASIPARAADAPAFVTSTAGTASVEGWSNGTFIIATYDQDVRGCGPATDPIPCATVTVTNRDGTAVVDGAGVAIDGILTSRGGSSFLFHDQVIWVPDLKRGVGDADDAVDANNVPLRALPEGLYTLKVQATGRTSQLQSTVTSVNFKVDNRAPIRFQYTSPKSNDVVVGELTLSGVVSDNVASGSLKSGIQTVRLHFFNAANPGSYKQVPVAGPGGTTIPTMQPTEITSLARFASVSNCDLNTPACVGFDSLGNEILIHDKKFEADLSTLSPGIWTVKAIARDVAGNASKEYSITFVKAA